MPQDSFLWRGSTSAHLHDPHVEAIGRVVVGLHGGDASRGASKNEDGALLWLGDDWVLAVVLDGHNSAESTNFVLDRFMSWKPQLEELCNGKQPGDFRALEQTIVRLLLESDTKDGLAAVRGETSCLVCFQRARYVMWLSIGDNSLYLLHPELARLGQYTLNVRNYFEWIGQRNSMALDVACYSSGVRELRAGINTLVLTTDGILEFGSRPFEDPKAFAAAIWREETLLASVTAMLSQAHRAGATDSTTLIAWQIDNPRPGLLPTS